MMAELNATSPSTEAIVNVISPQHFVVRAVPVADEVIRGEVGPIPPEGAYASALRSRNEILGLLEARIQEKGIPGFDWNALEHSLSDNFMVRELIVMLNRSGICFDAFRCVVTRNG